MDGDAFPAGHIADNLFAANGIAAAGAVHQQIAVALHADGIVAAVSAEDAPYHAGNAAGFLSVAVGDGRGGSWRQARQHLPR